MRIAWLWPLGTALVFAACTRVPIGPNVMVLPGVGKDFDRFAADDAICRQWAAQQTAITTSRPTTETTASGAAVGTVLGAAAGAAVGTAAGSPATGAVVGAGAGLLGGTAVGADRARRVRWSLQQRYDAAYMQCMYAKGNQIPIPAGSQPMTRSPGPSAVPPAVDAPISIPPPPAGKPPPPPSGPAR